MKDFHQELLGQISRQPIVFLTGAGTSFPSPSNIPTATNIIHAYADLYWRSKSVREGWQGKRKSFKDWLAGVWFEKVLNTNPPGAESYLMGLFKCTEWNGYHRFFAELIEAKGCFGITVNFDNGIELASEKVIPVSHPREFGDWADTVLSESSNTHRLLFKIHGSIDRQETIQVNLVQLQSSKSCRVS